MPMDSFKPQNAKPRKTKGIMKKSRVQIFSDLFFRSIEIIVVVVTVTKLIYQLVITFENSSEHFKGFAVLLVNRHFVFILGNTIIISLFALSGWHPNQASDTRSTNNSFYEEFVRENRREERELRVEMENRRKQSTHEGMKKQSAGETRKKQSIGNGVKQQSKGESMNKQNIGDGLKQSMDESMKKQSMGESTKKQNIAQDGETQNVTADGKRQSKNYERSRSENFQESKSSAGRLRSSETETYVDKLRSNYEKARDVDDGLSSDELRYKIETFIARQRRSQMDEEICII